MTPAICVDQIYNRYDKAEAVVDISFQMMGGEIFGFQGPNGSGKTMMINMLIGLARPDAVTVTFEKKADRSNDCCSLPFPWDF